MKISTLFYTIKQGFVNIFRNKWYSLAVSYTHLEPGQIAKGRRFKTVIGNPGMICYCVFWIAMIIIQMFPEIVTAITGNL